jgi:AraC family transcriptional regulator
MRYSDDHSSRTSVPNCLPEALSEGEAAEHRLPRLFPSKGRLRNLDEDTPAFSRLLCEWEGTRATLTLYMKNAVQPAHQHGEARLSFLLAGELTERVEGSAFDVLPGCVGYKPRGVWHQDCWGPHGALVLTLRIDSESMLPAGAQPGWSPIEDRSALHNIIQLFCGAPDAAHAEEAIFDLVALLPERPARRPQIPHWLLQARDQIRHAPAELNIRTVAAAAGVHRTHFSRVFRQYFGVSASEFRQQVKVARAISRLTKSETLLSAVAAEAGFSDQSHMNRAIKRAVALGPGQLRKAMIRATPVQAEHGWSFLI